MSLPKRFRLQPTCAPFEYCNATDRIAQEIHFTEEASGIGHDEERRTDWKRYTGICE